VILGRAIDDGVTAEARRVGLLGLVRADMQEAEVRGVDVAFEPLQPIAVALDAEQIALAVAEQHRLEHRQLRRLRPRAHVSPDQAVALDSGIGLGLDLLRKGLVLRHVRHVEAVAFDIELPAVIGAT